MPIFWQDLRVSQSFWQRRYRPDECPTCKRVRSGFEGKDRAIIVGVTGRGGPFALTRLLSKGLFGVTPTEALTFMSVSRLLSVVSLAACYVPARRAAKTDPLVALRGD